MKIAIEAQRIFRFNKHGMDYVALETIRQLQQIDTQNEYYILVSPGPDRCLKETANLHIIELDCPTYPLWEQWALPRAVRKIKPDLLHCTSNTAPICCARPLVLTLHDIIFLEQSRGSSKSWYQNLGRLYRRFVVPRVLSNCHTIITVSEFEHRHIEQLLHLPQRQVTTIRNGYSTHFKPLENTTQITRKYIDSPNYFFFLGNTDPKKNSERTLLAYALYVRQSPTPTPLLIADLKESVVDALLKEQDIQDIKPFLRSPGYIPNTDLPAIYSGARLFLYTSLRESFGIPILEAMACGTPVITSNASAMPEIAGEGAILVDPLSPAEIAAQITKLETDSAYRQEQIDYGLQRVKQFSWKRTAKQVLEIYKDVSSHASKESPTSKTK